MAMSSGSGICIITLHNVCSVYQGVFIHRRDTMGTLGGYYEYNGGCSVHWGISWVHWKMFSTSEDNMSTSGGYHEYIGGCSVHQGISWCMWGYHEYIKGYHEYIRGIYEYIRRISWVHRGILQYTEVFNRNWKVFTNLLPHMHYDFPHCTEHTPMYSWYSLMYSWYPPMYWTSVDVLMISPTCIMISPRYTEHPLMYWTHIIQGDSFFSCQNQQRIAFLLFFWPQWYSHQYFYENIQSGF